MRGLLVALLISLAGCTATGLHLPELQEESEPFPASLCEAVFPTGNWQFVHSISFSMKGGKGAVVIGVTTLTDESIRCGLMTVEGLTLFEAVQVQGKGLEIQQALPPFDKPAFAQGLMDDIHTIFVKPTGSIQLGKSLAGEKLCRFTVPSGGVVDVYPKVNTCWTVRKYSMGFELKRSVSGCWDTSPATAAVPDTLSLDALGYSLKMKLLSATPLR